MSKVQLAVGGSSLSTFVGESSPSYHERSNGIGAEVHVGAGAAMGKQPNHH